MEGGPATMKRKLASRHVTGVSPLDAGHHKKRPPLTGGVQMEGHIRVNRPPSETYRYWRDFQNMPSFMRHVESVVMEDDRHSHWVVKAPANTTMEWDAEIIDDQPNERISWRSTENAQVDNAGSVQFVPVEEGRETEVKVALTYN